MSYNITKKFLIKEYIEKKNPATQIAEKTGYCSSTIYKYLIKYNIPRRTKSEVTKGRNKKYNISKEFLIKEYNKNKKFQQEIAKEIGCSPSTVLRHLRKFNIEIRHTPANYIDGRTNKKCYCIDCGAQLKGDMAYKHKRCWKCYQEYKRRENHPNWKGGITSIYLLLRTTEEYKNWRNKVYEKANYRCEICGGGEHFLEAHHKKSYAGLLKEFLKEYDQFSPIEDKETLIRLAIKWQPFWDINNGKCLCEDCHKIITKQNIELNKGE